MAENVCNSRKWTFSLLMKQDSWNARPLLYPLR